MKMRFGLPQSLGGQLLLLLLLAVAVTQGLSVLLFSDERNRAVQAAMGLEAAGRAANVAVLLEEAPADLRDSILRSADSPLVRFRLDDRPFASAEADLAADLVDRVRQIMGGNKDIPVFGTVSRLNISADMPGARMGGPMRQMHEAMLQQRTEPFSLLLSIGLSDGSWLNVRSMFHRPAVQWSADAVVPLVLMVTAIIAIVLVVVGRIVRPMSALADGAERLGRGMDAEPLAVTGPREIRETTRAFNRMQARLTRFINDRTRMLGALGHDLRSPLTAMRIRLELLEENEDSTRLKALVDEMQTMVEATLDFARGAGQSEPVVEIDLAQMLSELVEDAKVAGADITLSVATPVRLAVRPTAIKRALRNLIDNAIRFGGRVEVALDTSEGEAVVGITDDGPGLPADQIERVFEPFVRLEGSRNRDTGGAGLGLAIARTNVQSHGGNITLANRETGGLQVLVRLPLGMNA